MKLQPTHGDPVGFSGQETLVSSACRVSLDFLLVLPSSLNRGLPCLAHEVCVGFPRLEMSTGDVSVPAFA